MPLSIGIGLGPSNGGGFGPYVVTNAEASALIARMTTPPSDTRKNQIDSLIGSLKTAGVWAKLDCLYLLAAADSQAASLNWKGSTFTLATVNAPTFTADRGYAGNGTTSYLNSGFNPTTAGGLFTLNNAHQALWTPSPPAGGWMLGNPTARLAILDAANGVVYSHANDATTSNVTTGASARYALWSRAASTAYDRYSNAVAQTSPAVPSTAMTSQAFAIGGDGSTSFSVGQVSAAHWGAAFVQAEVTALYNAVRTYLQGVGAA